MSVAAAIAEALPYLRREAEGRMRGTCRIDRPGDPVDDGKGGVAVPTVTVYEGRCYLRYPGLAFEQNTQAAGSPIVQSRIVIRVPFGVAYRPGDIATILTDPDNPQLANTVLRVASIDDMSQATAQRLLCEDNQAGV